MQDNNSSVKGSQSRNFSSAATLENSSSAKLSPLRDLYVLNKERIINDPKYSNEHIFDKQFKNIIVNQPLNIKPKNGSIYLTGIGNVNDIKSDLNQNIDSIPLNFQNLSKSLSKKNSNVNIRPKISLESLPYIQTNNNDYIKRNQIAPIFTCCTQELNPELLNKFYYQQKEKEKESRNRLCKTIENTNKVVKPSRQGGIIIPDGAKEYVNRARELNRIRYCLNLRAGSIKDYNHKIKDQIKSIDFTINSINAYKNNLENKYISEFNAQLRALEKVKLNEKLEDEKLKNELVKLKKENLILFSILKKNEMDKYYIEKWLRLQIYIKEGNYIDEKNIHNFISKNYNQKLIIDSVEEFNEMYKNKEKKNIKLINILNKINIEKNELYKELQNIKESLDEDKDLKINILEKEKLLNLLKMRNNDLLLEKKEVIKSYKNSSIIEKSHSIILSPKNFLKNKNKEKISKKINFSNIYKLIQIGYDYILENDKETLGDLGKNFQKINNIKNMNIKSTKALTQMKIIEMSYTYLFHYKEKNFEKNKKLYKNILDDIDLNKKRMKSEKHKKEEEQRAIELFKKLQVKRDKIIFKPTRQDIYSSLVYIEKMKKEAKKKTKNAKNEIDIYDFLYDIDEDENKIGENKK